MHILSKNPSMLVKPHDFDLAFKYLYYYKKKKR